MREIRKCAVVGAGVMGSGIAAQIANAGTPVLLLDVSREIAAGAVERLLKAEPPAFMSAPAARLVTPGSIDTDLAQIRSCDWIVEAIVEKLEAKRELYGKIEALAAKDAIVSSNTSTIPLSQLVANSGPGFRRNFLITHFFNPPRYMRLLEVVAGSETDVEALAAIERFADISLGKTVVTCRDRPGFIANRLGCFWMQCAFAEALAQGVTVEEADAVMGKPFGIPKTGVFGLADLVGLDLMPQVNASLARALEKGDLFHTINVPLPFVGQMIAQGLTGRKARSGFYRINRAANSRKEAIDIKTLTYHPAKDVRVDDGLSLIGAGSKHGRYATTVMTKTLAYAALLVGDAAGDIQSIDEAMRLGYNWKWGPFELIDRLGAAAFRKLLKAGGLPLAPILEAAGDGPFYRNGEALAFNGTYAVIAQPKGVLRLEDVKSKSRPLLRNASASLWDIGDGVACFELTTKMNAIDATALNQLNAAIDVVGREMKALVIYSEATNFSAGVNLAMLLFAANIAAWDQIESLVALGQQTYKRLKYAPFPSVAAPSGLALGGGCELLLHCSAVQAHAESYIGLVETSVGVIPGWSGCGQMLARAFANPLLPKGPMPAIAKVFETLSLAMVSKSAAHAKELMFLKASDGITMNRARLLADAKAKALSLTDGYAPPAKPVFHLPGPSAAAALGLQVESFRRIGKVTLHDVTVARRLATVLSGGGSDIIRPLGEDEMLTIERGEFMKLVGTRETLARVEYTLETGKPLRN